MNPLRLCICVYALSCVLGGSFAAGEAPNQEPAETMPDQPAGENPLPVVDANFEWPPVRHTLDRYALIWETSPFVVVTDLSGQQDELTGRYIITGFFQAGGRDVVLFFDRTSLERFSLSPGEERQGVTLQSLHHEGGLNGLRVVLNQGGRASDVGYDPKAVPMGPTNATAPPGAQPGHQGPNHTGAPPSAGQGTPGQTMVGGQPAVSGEERPTPRRIIRRRNIVAPE